MKCLPKITSDMLIDIIWYIPHRKVFDILNRYGVKKVEEIPNLKQDDLKQIYGQLFGLQKHQVQWLI